MSNEIHTTNPPKNINAALNNIDSEAGECAQLVEIAQQLMMNDFSSPDTAPIYSMLRAIEYQQARLKAAVEAAWDVHFDRKGDAA